MTIQTSERLINQFTEIDFSQLHLKMVFVGRPGIFNEKPYPFKVKPQTVSGYINSSCWRGYIAHFVLDNCGALVLIKYQILGGAEQIVNETLVGNFWLELKHDRYEGALCVPFKNGKIDSNKNTWKGYGEVLNHYQNDDSAKIRDFVEQRKIVHLVHFTRLDNLESILRNGLIGRDELDSLKKTYLFNDKYRYDNVANSNCLSVSFPNYKMFYSYQCQYPNADWVVIRLKPEILWKKKLIFCARNAAVKEIAQQSIEQRSGFQAFKNMFENQDGYPTREIVNIPNHYTTNPQAEVLVMENIEPSLIIDVCVEREDVILNHPRRAQIKECSKNIKFYRKTSYFSPREDHKHWQNDHGKKTAVFTL